MTTTDLQVQFHNFAGGRPAIGIALSRLEEMISDFGNQLSGRFPDRPHTFMKNAKLPIYKLAYSGFIDDLSLDLSGHKPKLNVEMRATVHPFSSPSRVIAEYNISLGQPIEVFLSYSQPSQELRWASRVSPLASVKPKFTNDAESILLDLGVSDPVLETYEHKVETPIVWNTAQNFVQTVLNALPPIEIRELADWLTLLEPLQFDFGNRFLVITSDKAKISLGKCSPEDVLVEADPDFPYGRPPPVGGVHSKVLASVYLPKTRLVDFVSKNVMPAVMFDTGERGGIVKWRMNGAFGFKAFSIQLKDGVEMGNPWSGDLTLRGSLSAQTDLSVTGVARAWVDGPCGTRVGLASASIQGDGAFAADLAITYRSTGGHRGPDYEATVEAEMLVTQAELDPNIDIEMVGWPIDDIVGELADHLVEREVHKMSGMVRKLGRWEVIGVPSWLVDLESVGDAAALAPVVEAQEGVSAVFGIFYLPG